MSSLVIDEDSVPSWVQERLWFVCQLDPASPAHHLAAALHLRGQLDLAALGLALSEVTGRHGSLRTRFPSDDGQPRREVTSPGSVEPPVEQMKSDSPEGVERRAIVWATQEAKQPFDLASGPLFRAKLLRLSDDDHWLLLSTHRIVCDEASVGIILVELRQLYVAFSEGRTSPLGPSADYSETVRRHRERLADQGLEDLLGFWNPRVGKNPPVLELPADRLRPAVQTSRGATVSVVIPPSVVRDLAVLSDSKDRPIPAGLLAAFSVLLQRYSGATRLLLGIEVDGRDNQVSEAVVGPLANAVVVEADLFDDLSFTELVRQLSRTLDEALSRRELPFELLIEALKPDRRLSHSPVFQVLVRTAAPRAHTQQWGKVDVEMIDLDLGVARFDLTFVVNERDEGVVCDLEYNADLFDADRILRMGGHLLTLLEAAVANPSTTVRSLPLLTPAERVQQLVDWNDTAAPFPADRCTHELFEEQAKMSPHFVAVQCDGISLSYDELDKQSNQLAHWLRDQGIGPDAPVGLCLERSVNMLVALLGVLKAGAAYVPLDPAYPPDRIAFMLEDVEAKVLLTSSHLLERLSLGDERVLCVDRDWSEVTCLPDQRPDPLASPSNLAYVIYTSGSTGKPKGVRIPHRALVNLLCSFRDIIAIGVEDAFLAVTSLSFDIAGLELFLPLIVGARVVLATRDEATDGPRLRRLLASSGATILQGTPATWRLLIEAGWEGGTPLVALCGGEALARDLAASLVARASVAWNLYGPTETTIWSCAYRLDAPPESAVPIGRPIANTEVYLLSPALQPVPVGVPGELYIGGYGLAAGYHHRPDLTGERFIAHPFNEQRDARLYRTGDLASYRPDGVIEFLGRVDDQVKVRGFRIELGEIEANLMKHAAIRAAVVVAREHRGELRLVGYVIPIGGDTPSTADLRAWLSRSLPEHMLPELIVSLSTLPLTPNGKVDRRALPDPEVSGRVRMAARVPASNREEEELLEIWQKLLGLNDPIGVTDDFFELGGNSLLAARLLAEVERWFHRQVPLTVLFEDATIEHLAAGIRKQELDPSPLITLQPRGDRPPVFCFHLGPGGMLAMRHILPALGEDQPLVGLMVSALPWVGPDSRIEDIAAAFVEPVTERQPSGSLYLFGHSLGGLVAYELAQQLEAMGRDIRYVGMADTACPPALCSGRVARIMRRFVASAEVWFRCLSRPSTWATRRRSGGRQLILPASDKLVPGAATAIEQRYLPRGYGGRVAIFRTRETAMLAGDELLGWGPYLTGERETHGLPGDHGSILRKPHVDVLSAALVRSLGQARTDKGTGSPC
jgi:amino acid adenylation domain-containing protein